MDKKYLYINGSSISAGGGFEEYQYRKDVRDSYKEKGIDVPNSQIECCFGYHISKELNLELINESKSGSGIDRMIRTTYDWILKNRKKSKSTIFILEPQVGIRLDWYVSEWKDYGILNAHLNNEGKYPFTLVKDWFTDDSSEQNNWNEKYKKSIDGFFENFYNEDVYLKNELSKLVFFISYLNEMKMDYFVSVPEFIPSILKYDLNNVIPFKKNINNFLDNMGLWRYCESKNWLIMDEIKIKDNHIGFFGNKNISDKLIKIISN